MPRSGKKGRAAASLRRRQGGGQNAEPVLSFGPLGGVNAFEGTSKQLVESVRTQTQSSTKSAEACLGASGLGSLPGPGDSRDDKKTAVWQELHTLGLHEVLVAAMRKHKSSAGVQTA